MSRIYEELNDRRLGRLFHRRTTQGERIMEKYRVAEDVTETLPDGRIIQVAAAGTELPLEQARELGLVKDQQDAGPAETKASKKAKE